MKNLFVLLTFVVAPLFLFSQTHADTMVALAIKGDPFFDQNFFYTFDKKVFELNQDSTKLYELALKNPKPSKLKSWSEHANYSEKYEANRGWHKGPLVKELENWNGPIGFHDYVCGLGSYKVAIREMKNKGEGAWKIKSHKEGNILVITKIDEVQTYLLFHPKIIPSQVLLVEAWSDCWSFPVLTRYEKPTLQMKFLPDSVATSIDLSSPHPVMKKIDPSSFSIIEKLVNSPDVHYAVGSWLLLGDEEELDSIVAEKFDLEVSAKDTIQFLDFDKEDGDKVSIFFDGNLIQPNLSIEHSPFTVFPQNKVERIDIQVESEGEKPTCTLEVVINGKSQKFSRNKGDRISVLRK